MDVDVKEGQAPADGSAAIDWEDRQLCSDGNCIGVIGPDGRCKECGRPHAPADAFEAPAADARPAAEPSDRAPAAEPSGQAPATEPSDGPVDDWERRRLCSDGNCIGVIGSDGRCRECGKPYAG